jgi:cytochrome P450
VQTLRYLADPNRFIDDCRRRYGDVFTIETVVFGPEVCVVRPEHIKAIFTGDPDKLRAGEANAALEPLVGRRSVLLLDGAEHLRQRRLMMPPFHAGRMQAYARTMREITTRIVDEWPLRKSFTMHPEMQRVTLEIILRTIFGADEGAELEELREGIAGLLDRLSSSITMLGTIPALRRHVWGLSPWARFQKASAEVDAVIFRQIARRRRERDIPRTDVLSLLLEARDEDGQPMTDIELRDELMTLLAAGHETTATELAWSFDLILRAPKVLRRIHDEMSEARTGAAGELDFERMPYLDATIKEVLRLRPAIPAVGRKVQEPMVFAGFDIPKGMLLVPALYLTHRLPDIYPDPDELRPERFLDTKSDPYAFLPFGGGIRRCIGLAFALFEMKVVLATILARVSLELTRPEPAKVKLRGFTHAPNGGVPVKVVQRRPALRSSSPMQPPRSHVIS